MKTIRWGMIGCGDVAEVKSGPGFYKAAITRRWSQSCAATVRLPPITRAVTAWRGGRRRRCHHPRDGHRRRLYRDADRQPSRLHTALCACRQAGLRRKADGDAACRVREMIEACRDAAVPLWVGYYRRALPRFLKVRDLVESGAIGPVRMVISRQFARAPQIADGDALPWRIDPAKSGGGFFFEAVCHTFDFLDFRVRPDCRRARCRVQPVRGLSCRGHGGGSIPIPVRRPGLRHVVLRRR